MTILKFNTEKDFVQRFEILPLVVGYDPILHKPTVEFDFMNPPEAPGFIASCLFETMYEHKGIGLSANQCGKPYRVFVIGDDRKTQQAFFNCHLIWNSDEESEQTEGCLSYPLFFGKIKRFNQIGVRYQDVNGTTHERQFIGLTSRVIQHELDHMDGKTLHDRMGKTSVLVAKKKQEKELRNLSRTKKQLARR
jgi:peptide deformylase